MFPMKRLNFVVNNPLSDLPNPKLSLMARNVCKCRCHAFG